LNIPDLATLSSLTLIGLRAFFKSFVKYGIKPHLSTSRWHSPSRVTRTTGASMVGAMFHVGARFGSRFTVPKILAMASAGRKLA